MPTQTVFISAPVGGVNASDALGALPPNDSVFAYNLIPTQYGLRVRRGYIEHAYNLEGDATEGTDEVRTVIPYNGSTSSEAALFACTSQGIIDITAGGDFAGATPDVTWGTADADAGYCCHLHFTTIADRYLLVCDESNGYYYRDETTGTWTKPTAGSGAGQIDGADPADFVYVCMWKNRLWFVEKDSSRAWYLPVGSITGAVTEFDLGSRFKYGGHLKAIYNWTVDGGEGIDDYLVFVSEGGDVVVYKGTDPASAATFDLRGMWYITNTPKGRRVGTQYGGELILLSVFGAVPLSKLVAGEEVQVDSNVYTTRKITPLITTLMEVVRDEYGWELKIHPRDNLIFISSPKQDGLDWVQFAQNIVTRGWTIYQNFPYLTSEVWEGEMYFGTSDGRVCIHRGDLDNVAYGAQTGDEIEWNLLTSFSHLESPGINKRIQMVRPRFVSGIKPVYHITSRYDFDINPLSATLTYSGVTVGVWGSGVFDSSVWGGGFIIDQYPQGGHGMGKSCAVGINGRSASPTTLVGFEMAFDIGGYL